MEVPILLKRPLQTGDDQAKKCTWRGTPWGKEGRKEGYSCCREKLGCDNPPGQFPTCTSLKNRILIDCANDQPGQFLDVREPLNYISRIKIRQIHCLHWQENTKQPCLTQQSGIDGFRPKFRQQLDQDS